MNHKGTLLTKNAKSISRLLSCISINNVNNYCLKNNPVCYRIYSSKNNSVKNKTSKYK